MFRSLRTFAVLFCLWLSGAATAGSVWVSDGNQVYTIDAMTAWAVPLANGTVINALAPVAGGAAWLLTDHALLPLTTRGGLAGAPISLESIHAQGARALAVNPFNGTLWLGGSASRLIHLDVQGMPIASDVLNENADALTVAQDETVWVLSGAQVSQYSAKGALLRTIDLAVTPGTVAFRIAVDSIGNIAWVAARSKLIRIDLTAKGAAQQSLIEMPVQDIALDQKSGTLWALSNGLLNIYGTARSNKPVIDLSSLGLRNLSGLAHDATDGSLWLTHGSGVSHLSATGVLLPNYTILPPMGAVAATPFWIRPRLALVDMTPGFMTANTQPTFRLGIDALCSEVPCDQPVTFANAVNLFVSLDTRDVSQLVSRETLPGYAAFTPAQPLPPGKHNFTAVATDSSGHASNRIEADFTVVGTGQTTLPNGMINAAAARNKPPTISITAPTPGAAFTDGTKISISAIAADADGTVTKVDFKAGSALIGTTLSSPYTVTWSNVLTGSYTLTAIATDNSGATTTSAPVSMTVNATANTPPSVAIATPVNGAVFTVPASITVTANASDSDGTVSKVDFYQGSTLIGTAGAAPYAITWSNAAAGAYNLTARATDNRSAVTTSAAVAITVALPNSPPLVVLTQPVPCTVSQAPTDISLRADAADLDGRVTMVEFFQGTTLIGKVAKEPYILVWSNIVAGTYTITARATDDRGAVTVSVPVTVTVTSPNIAPAISLTAPGEGAVFGPGASVALAATAADSDGTVSKVDFYAGTTHIGTATAAPYAVNWISGAGGSTSLTAVATDNSGAATTSAAVHVTVTADTPPTASLTSPLAGATFGAGATIVLIANATDSDGSVAKVDFYAGSTYIGTATDAPYSVSWNGMASGAYLLTAKATDNLGVSTTSAAMQIAIVPNNPPEVSLTAPATDAKYIGPAMVSLAATATASDSDGSVVKVDFYADATWIGGVTSAPYAATWQNAPGGSYMLTARATDNMGVSTTSAPVQVVIDAPPVLTITAPANGTVYTVPGNVDITVRLTDADGTLTAVDLYLDGVLLWAPTLPAGNADVTLNYHWSSVPAGSYTFVAHGKDNLGAVTTSAPVHVVVHADPAVTLNTPADGAAYHPGSAISLTASASENGGTIRKVDFYAGATLVGTAGNPPYTATWPDVAAGVYAVTAVATDNLGYVGTSTAAMVTVSANLPPDVKLAAPANGTGYHAPANVVLSASATDSDGSVAKVDFYQGQTVIGTATSAPYTVTWPNAASGTYVITAVATDNLGATATSPAATITVSDNYPPDVGLRVTGGGSGFTPPATLNLNATASDSDGTVTKVELYQGGTLLATLTSPPYTYTLDNVAEGSYNFTARAIDNLGAASVSSPANIAVSAQTIALTTPADGSTVNSDRVQVAGTLHAPPNSAVSINGVLGTVTTDGGFFFNNVALQPGSNALTIVASTVDGQLASQGITVNSTGVSPFAFMASPSHGFAPLVTRFELANRGNASIRRIELLCSDNSFGFVSLTVATAAELSNSGCSYITPGVYRARVNVYTQPEGQAEQLAYTTTQSIYAASVPAVDMMLREVYATMLARLKAGNVDAALHAATAGVYDKFTAIIGALGTKLPVLVDMLGPITNGRISPSHAEYLVIRNTPDGRIGYPVQFIRGEDGLWRIDGM